MSHRELARDGLIALVLAGLSFGVYLRSPVGQLSDSVFTLLLSEQVLRHGSFELDAYFGPDVDMSDYPGAKEGGRPRHIQPLGVVHGELRGATGPLYYIYPFGTSLLSLPVVALANRSGVSLVREGNRYDAKVEKRLQRLTAAALMGLAVGLFFLIARQYLDRPWSLAVASWGGFATQIWSTASRGLWSHTWDVVLLAVVVLHLVRVENRVGRLRPVLLATLLAWGYFVRPMAVFYIVPITLYVLARDLRRGSIVVATGGVWLGLFVAFNEYTFGHWLPDYYRQARDLGLETWATGFLAHTISPSRGLFVQLPMLALIGAALVVWRRRLMHRGLAAAAVAALGLQLLVVPAFSNYWSGQCYGPRFFTDLVPLFVLLAAITAQSWRAHSSGSEKRRRLRALRLGVAVCFVAGMLIHGAGAWSPRSASWSRGIAQDPARIFDWRHSQWACALSPRWCPPGVLRG